MRRFEFLSPHMGTEFSITLFAPDQATAQDAAEAAFRRIAGLEDIMSDYQADSELMRLCGQPPGQPVPISADLFAVLERAQKISAFSHGAFDVTVGPYVRLWRFSRKRKVLPTPAELATARQAVGWPKLRLDHHAHTATLLVPNMRLDLGGIGKGYAADQALKVLQSRGIDRALVAASGDLAIGRAPPGQPGWRVAIGGLATVTNQAPRFLVLADAGVSTAGDLEQFVDIGGVRYSHIVDPATGLGLTNRIQVTVIARDATTSDGLDDAICVLGVQQGLALLKKFPHTQARVVTPERTWEPTGN